MRALQPTRRLIQFVLMTMLLLFSQHQLLAHELSHAHRLGSHERQEQASFQHACEKCVSLAPFTGAAATALPSLFLAQGKHTTTTEPEAHPATGFTIQRRNRDPPSLL